MRHFTDAFGCCYLERVSSFLTALQHNVGYAVQWQRSVINLVGSRPHLSLHQPSSPFFPSLSWNLRGVWTEPAHPLPNTLMQLIQSNSFMKSTLMFNVLPGTEISVYAEFSHNRQNWCFGLQAMSSSMAVKSGGTFGPPHWQKVRGSGPQDPHIIASTDLVPYN